MNMGPHTFWNSRKLSLSPQYGKENVTICIGNNNFNEYEAAHFLGIHES